METAPRVAAAVTPEQPKRRLRKRAVARFALLILVVLGALAALRWTPLAELTNREVVVAQLDALSQAWWAPLALLGLYLFVCSFGLPVSGLIFAGAVVFGPVRGTIFNVLGSFLGALVAFVVARSLGRELVEHLAGDRLKRVERLMDRQGFWTLLRIRLLPVPFPMINFGAALVGVKPLTYVTSSFFGILIPIGLFSILYASIGRALLQATGDEARAMTLDALGKVLLLLVVLVAVTSLPQLWINLQRRRRYQRLLEERRQRHSS